MSDLNELQTRLRLAEEERDKFKDKVQQLDTVLADLSIKLELKDAELQDLRSKSKVTSSETNGLLADDGYEALKQVVTDLLTQNEEKNLKIEELQKAVHTYQKVEEIILGSQSAKHVRSGENSAVPTLDRGRRATSPRAGSTSALPSTEDVRGQLAVKRTVSVQRSNSYDASRFNRTEVGEDSNGRKVSCTSLPKDYGYKVNMSTDVAEGPAVEEVRKETKRKKGFKRFFSRIRRSTSQEALPTSSPLKRGGVRATAGARLGGSRITANNKYQPVQSDTFFNPFSEWSTQQVSIWLQDIGLAMYVKECHGWCKGGQHMLDASQHEVEKQLKVHNLLHKKKLKLLLDGMRSGNRKDHVILDGLNTECVMKWLDDIGLPQYKHQFYEARIDGRMLNHLTVDDLLLMKINNALHHMSIKRGIEVLRRHQFNLGTLRRRPSPERTNNCSTLNGGDIAQKDRDVSLWTNHRVMEWLRMIDLSEYAANLRGSGVHGALIMLEPRFTMDHLADILIIPTSKSLIRRHLSGHFVNLIGQQVQAKKREAECAVGMTLTLNMKVKGKKANLFKRGRPVSEYLCPIENNNDMEPANKNESQKVKTAVAMYKKELSKQEAKKRDAKTKRQSS